MRFGMVAAAAVALVCAGQADAAFPEFGGTLVTFSGLPLGVSNLTSYTEKGFLFTPVNAGQGFESDTLAGELRLDQANGFSIYDVVKANGQSFTFDGVDITKPSFGAQLNYSGFFGTNEFLVGAISASQVGTAFSFNNPKVTRIRFYAYNGSISVDNFAFDVPIPTSPTPEPATWAMMILGMGVVGFTIRRSNKKFDAKTKRATAAIA